MSHDRLVCQVARKVCVTMPCFRRVVSCLLNPKKCTYKYIILFLLCYIQFSSVYCTESPGGLKEIIINVLKIDNAQYSLIFSVTGWIGIVICVTGGFIIDKYIGVRLGCTIFVLLALLGQIIYTLGIFLDNFLVVLIGRTIFGASNRLFHIAIMVYRALWFDKDISIAVSSGMSFYSFGGFVALSAPAFLYKQTEQFINDPLYRLGSVTFVDILVLFIALVFSLIIMALDWRGEKILGKRQSSSSGSSSLLNCQKLKNFTPLFWIYVAVYSLFFSSYFTFGANGQSFYIFRYNLDLYQASLANSLIYFANAFVSVLCGVLIGITGYNGYWGMLGSLIFGGANLLLAMSNQYTFVPYLGSFLISVSYATFTVSIIPVPLYLVDKNQLSLSYGMMESSASLIFSLLSALGGVLIDHAGYFALAILYIFISYSSLILLITAAIMEYGEDEHKVNFRRSCIK